MVTTMINRAAARVSLDYGFIRPISLHLKGGLGTLTAADQADDEDAAPVVHSEQGDVPVAIGAGTDTTTEAILSTRTSRAWTRVLPALVVIAVILVFVFQNPKDVKVRLFTFLRTLPLSVALLGAVVLGALMVLALGSVRMFQLRGQIHRKKVGPERNS
jgi:uncharacterized integral membrane protein